MRGFQEKMSNMQVAGKKGQSTIDNRTRLKDILIEIENLDYNKNDEIIIDSQKKRQIQ